MQLNHAFTHRNMHYRILRYKTTPSNNQNLELAIEDNLITFTGQFDYLNTCNDQCDFMQQPMQVIGTYYTDNIFRAYCNPMNGIQCPLSDGRELSRWKETSFLLYVRVRTRVRIKHPCICQLVTFSVQSGA